MRANVEILFLQELFSMNDLVLKDRVFGTMILVQSSKNVYMQTFDYSRLTKHHQAPSSNSGLIIYTVFKINMLPPFQEDSWTLNHPKWDGKKKHLRPKPIFWASSPTRWTCGPLVGDEAQKIGFGLRCFFFPIPFRVVQGP